MGRKTVLYFIAVIMMVSTAIAFSVFASSSDDKANIQFLNGFGWEVNNEAIECQRVKIPEPFDMVYESYNQIQLEAGLDLTPFMGMEGVRYTYTVLNYPKNVGEEIRANVICVQGKPVGGDIMTVSIHGFMHSLKFPEE